MVVETWTAGWQERFRSIVHKMGYEDVFDFVVSRRRQSFGELFGAVREFAVSAGVQSLAFVQLAELFYIDANQRGQLRKAVMESLVRSFCQFMRSGWNRGKKIRERRIRVEAYWPVPHLVTHSKWTHEEWRAFQSRVFFWKSSRLSRPTNGVRRAVTTAPFKKPSIAFGHLPRAFKDKFKFRRVGIARHEQPNHASISERAGAA